MADHAHQRILEAVQTVLIAAATAASSRVYLDRVDEIPAASLPAIDILGAGDTGEDSIEHLTVNFPQRMHHAYSFAIRCVASQASAAAKASRNLAAQVETALLAAVGTIAIGSVAIDMLLAGVAEIKDGDGAAAMFAVRMDWQAQYTTAGGAPDVPI